MVQNLTFSRGIKYRQVIRSFDMNNETIYVNYHIRIQYTKTQAKQTHKASFVHGEYHFQLFCVRILFVSNSKYMQIILLCNFIKN